MRSKLFVPASRPELFSKALTSQADALSFDLEDAVHEDRKDEARETLRQFLSGDDAARSGKLIIVRVNDLSTPHFARDLAAVVLPCVHAVNIPKVNSPEDVLTVASQLDELEQARGIATPIKLLVNIETPAALRRAAEIGQAHPRIMGIQVGLADLFEPMGIDRTNVEAVTQVQIIARLAAGEANVEIFDGAYVDIPNKEGYAAEAMAVKRMGYSGKTCIHPSQIAIANAIFRSSDAEIAHASNVVEATRGASQTGTGAFVVDGKMIDGPYIHRANRILDEARRLGLTA